MNKQQSFTSHYKTLRLSQNSDLESCKYAYKRSVKQWHPDKFINNEEEQQFAEEKLKEINVAYFKITEYYQQNGVMPEISVTVSSRQNETAFDVSSLYQNLNTEKVLEKRNYKKYLSILFLSIALIFIYQTLFTQDPNTVFSTLGGTSKQNSQLQPLNTKTNYFSKGSSQQAVLKIHGQPDFTISQTWHYGNSWILFQNGIVIDWYQDKKYPLNSISENDIPYTQKRITAKNFEKGDSKSDVRIIQGEPVRKSRDTWYYQISKVYFKKDKVTSWFNSPLDPLRVNK